MRTRVAAARRAALDSSPSGGAGIPTQRAVTHSTCRYVLSQITARATRRRCACFVCKLATCVCGVCLWQTRLQLQRAHALRMGARAPYDKGASCANVACIIRTGNTVFTLTCAQREGELNMSFLWERKSTHSRIQHATPNKGAAFSFVPPSRQSVRSVFVEARIRSYKFRVCGWSFVSLSLQSCYNTASQDEASRLLCFWCACDGRTHLQARS